MRFDFKTLLVCCALGFAGCSKEEPVKPKPAAEEPLPVTVAKVELVPLDRTLPVVGTLFADNEATLAAQVEGKVEKTMAEFGDRVRRDQELALIDTASYEAFARQAAANLDRAKANALNAGQNFKRVQSLAGEKIASPSDLDKATADAEQATAEVKAAEAANAIAQLNLTRSRVKAPFEGAVSERLATMGDYMKVGTPLFHLVNDENLKFIVQAPEAFAHEIQKEQLVRFTVDDWPTNVFEGRVYLISPQVNTNSRAFQIAARVPNADRRLKANSYARGELLLQKGVPTPTVPLEAVVNFAGVTKVFVVENNVARSQSVTVGRVVDGRQEIRSGLQVGDTVACSAVSKLSDGCKVRLRETVEEKTAKVAENRP